MTFVLGTVGVLASLSKIKDEVDRVTDEVLEDSASFGAEYTRAIAPIDTGAYRYGGVSRSGTQVAEPGISSIKVGDLSYAWGTDAPYGRALELGHPITMAPPQPHFGPSMDRVGPYFIDSMLDLGFRR